MKIETEGVDAFPEESALILSFVGHPEALITDRTWITDFIEYDLKGVKYEAAKSAVWEKIEERYPGIAVRGLVSILELSRKIHEYTSGGHA